MTFIFFLVTDFYLLEAYLIYTSKKKKAYLI